MSELHRFMTAVPAGWYPDPTEREDERYWDGAAWTARTRSAPVEPGGSVEEGHGPDAESLREPGQLTAETASDRGSAHADRGAPPAGWYPDPAGQTRERWWDGSRWTERTRDDHVTAAMHTRGGNDRPATAEDNDLPALPPDEPGSNLDHAPGPRMERARMPNGSATSSSRPPPDRTPALSFFEAVDLAVRRSFDVHGRSRRSEFWWFVLLQALFLTIAMAAGTTALIVVSAILIVPYTTLAIRRMHDTGRSGAWVFWLLYAPQVPQLIGLLLMWQGSLGAGLAFTATGSLLAFPCVVIAIVLLAMPGDPTPNAYGPPTAHTTGSRQPT